MRKSLWNPEYRMNVYHSDSPEGYLQTDNLAVGPVHVVQVVEGELRVPPVGRVEEVEKVAQQRYAVWPRDLCAQVRQHQHKEYYDNL